MPCSPKLRRCVDDLIAQGKPESSAWAICRAQLGESVRRHPDFNKIYKQFLNYNDGESRYYTWITALNLDETKQYADSRREKFAWTRRHVDFGLWKEDTQAKYWQVEAGFPVESMNENVYSLEELQESGRTLAHKEVNLNHKYSLPTVDIPAAKYEDGLVEAILRVPKRLNCPICDKNKTINDLIESGEIVNVSLEAVCTLKSDDPNKCEGMEFTGLSLLTKDTLPGIPLTRLMPLESIMVEALQTSTKGRIKMKKPILRIKAKVKEQAQDIKPGSHYCEEHPDDPRCKEHKKAIHGTEQNQPDPTCPDGEHYDITLRKCVPDSAGAKMPPIGEAGTVEVPQPSAGPKPDAHGQCRDDQKWSDLQGKCVPIDQTPEQVPSPSLPEKAAQSIEPDLASTSLGRPAAGDGKILTSGPDLAHQGTPTMSTRETTYAGEPGGVSTPPEIIHGGDAMPPTMHKEPTGTNEPTTPSPLEPTTHRAIPKAPIVDMPEGDTSMHPTAPATMTPKEPHVCPDGQHWDSDAEACMPDADLTEQVRRIKAEYGLAKAREDAQFVEKVWIEKYSKLDREYRSLLASKVHIDKFYRERLDYERRRNEALTKDYQESEIARRDINNRFAELDREKRKIEGYVTDLRVTNEDLQKKYHGALSMNLQLSRKNTQSNEDYLDIAKERDLLKEKLDKARINAKKTLKLKA